MFLINFSPVSDLSLEKTEFELTLELCFKGRDKCLIQITKRQQADLFLSIFLTLYSVLHHLSFQNSSVAEMGQRFRKSCSYEKKWTGQLHLSQQLNKRVWSFDAISFPFALRSSNFVA